MTPAAPGGADSPRRPRLFYALRVTGHDGAVRYLGPLYSGDHDARAAELRQELDEACDYRGPRAWERVLNVLAGHLADSGCEHHVEAVPLEPLEPSP